MKYKISDLAHTKGISEPVRQALYAMEEEIAKKDKRIAELEQALRYVVSVYMVSDYSDDVKRDTDKAVQWVLEHARKALEGKKWKK